MKFLRHCEMVVQISNHCSDNIRNTHPAISSGSMGFVMVRRIRYEETVRQGEFRITIQICVRKTTRFRQEITRPHATPHGHGPILLRKLNRVSLCSSCCLQALHSALDDIINIDRHHPPSALLLILEGRSPFPPLWPASEKFYRPTGKLIRVGSITAHTEICTLSGKHRGPPVLLKKVRLCTTLLYLLR